MFSPTHVLARFRPFFSVQGNFKDPDIRREIRESLSFAQKCRKMSAFLVKLLEEVEKREKKFEEDVVKNASLNKFLYEYEINSVQSYSPHTNAYLGSVVNKPSLEQLPE